MRFAATLLALLVGCGGGDDAPHLIEGTTYRIGKPVQREQNQLNVKIFTSEGDCRADSIAAQSRIELEEIDDCVPIVDRSRGQMRLAFALETADLDPKYLPLEAEDVRVFQDNNSVQDFELIPHHPIRADQLFVIIVDGSGSMYNDDAGEPMIDRVYRALIRRDVIDAFFPDRSLEVDTGVVLLRFSSGDPRGLDGNPPRVIENESEYKDALQYIKTTERGYTHLYNAVEWGIGPMLEVPDLQRWQARHRAELTYIVLTDGFNNEQSSDRCRDNAPRLRELLTSISASTFREDLEMRPRIYTVGLGQKIRPDFDIEAVGDPNPRSLCGDVADQRIDGGLELRGIDNPSLEWIAQRGNGEAYVTSNRDGLSEVFLAAAATRHSWYEARFQVDPLSHRRSFKAGVQLAHYAKAGASVDVHPSGWLDAPTPATEEGEKWAEPRPMAATLGLLMPVLGGLVFLHFLGPATFNGRRALTRRARRRKR